MVRWAWCAVPWQAVWQGWEYWCRGGSCGLGLRGVVRVTRGPYTTGLYKGAAAVWCVPGKQVNRLAGFSSQRGANVFWRKLVASFFKAVF